MAFKYIAFHWFVHLFLAFLIVLWFRPNFTSSFLIFLFTILIDLDHLPTVLKEGFNAILKFTKPRSYFFHNFLFLGFFILLAILFVNILKLIFLSLVLHLAWDLLEDVLILKVGIKHWFIKRNK